VGGRCRHAIFEDIAAWHNRQQRYSALCSRFHAKSERLYVYPVRFGHQNGARSTHHRAPGVAFTIQESLNLRTNALFGRHNLLYHLVRQVPDWPLSVE
jgi:hypothetical protein